MKHLPFTLLLVAFCGGIFAQNNFEGKLVYDSENSKTKRANSELNQLFSKYSIYQIETKAIENYLQHSTNGISNINLKLGNKEWKLHLKLHDIRSKSYIFQQNTEDGLIIHPPTPAFTYRGYNGDNKNDRVVLAIRENCFSGYVQKNGEFFYIESAKNLESNSEKNEFVVYNAKNMRKAEIGSCSQSATIQDAVSKKNTESRNGERIITKCAEFGVAYDQSFKKKLGNNAESTLTARLNLVSDHYEKEFNIEYKLITIYECRANEFTPDSNTESCKEGGGTCQDGTVLKEFSKWGNSPDGFGGVKRDVATFWTGRNLKDGSNTGNIGYSFFAGICNGKGYNIVEDYFRTGNNAHASIWIHELGHTWNAYHVANNATNMMSPSIYGNNGTEPTNRYVTNSTRKSINAHRDSRTCLSDGCINVGVDETEIQDQDLVGFPNPFNNEVRLSYHLNQAEVVKIRIFDGLGQLVYEKNLGKQPKGKNSITWNGNSNLSKNISTGFFMANITIGNNQQKNVRLIKLQ